MRRWLASYSSQQVTVYRDVRGAVHVLAKPQTEHLQVFDNHPAVVFAGWQRTFADLKESVRCGPLGSNGQSHTVIATKIYSITLLHDGMFPDTVLSADHLLRPDDLDTVERAFHWY